MYGKHERRRTRPRLYAIGLIALSSAWLSCIEPGSAAATEQESTIAGCDRALEQLMAAQQHFSRAKDKVAAGEFTLDLLLDSQRRQLEAEEVYLDAVSEASADSRVSKHISAIATQLKLRSLRGEIEYLQSLWRTLDPLDIVETQQLLEQYRFLKSQLSEIEGG